MAKKRNRKKTAKVSPNIMLEQIYTELRSIVRQRSHLRRPINGFVLIEGIPEGQPRFRVAFDSCPRKNIKGLKVFVEKLVLPDEKIIDDVLAFAKSIWHLRDRLIIWTKLKNSDLDIRKYAKENVNLMICADLANKKKHGRAENRSGFNPELKIEIEFDTSRNGVLEFFYDGLLREKELLVSIPEPIPYRVEILRGDGNSLADDAVNFISEAFDYWKLILDDIDIFKQDSAVSKELKLLLS